MPQTTTKDRRQQRWRWRWTLGVLLLALLAGCGKDSDGGTPTSAPAAQPKPAVPAPQGLLAEVLIGQPEITWRKLRLAVGGPALFLPTSIGGLLANLLELPVIVAPRIDDKLPVVGAIASSGPEPSAGPALAALAVNVKRGSSFVSQLTVGEHGRFDSTAEGDIVWLRRKQAPARPARPTLLDPSEITLAVIDSYLVIATAEQAVRRLGPYLARTLSRRQAPADDLVIEAPSAAWLDPAAAEIRKGHVVPALLLAGDKQKAAGPIAQLLDGLLADLLGELLSGARGFRLTVNLEQSLTASAQLRLEQATGKRLRQLATMSPEALLTLPDDTVATATYVESRQRRSGSSKPLAKLLLALVPSQAAVTAEHRDALSSAIAALSAGRGDRTTLGVRCSGTGLTGFALGDVHDSQAFSRGFDELSALLQTKAATELLAAASLKLTTEKTRLRHLPHGVTRVRLASTKQPPAGEAGAGSPAPEPIDLLLSVQPQRFLAAAGMNPTETLQLLYQPSPEQSLGGQAPGLKKMLAGLPSAAWVATLIDVAALPSCQPAGKPGQRGPLPVALAIGPAPDGAELRLQLPRELLKPLFKQLSW